jgi:uncharacterized membrane protein (UPF0182 family)
MNDIVQPSRRLGITGSVFGLLALLVAALTHLLPQEMLYKNVTGTAGSTWSDIDSTSAASLGLVAIALAVFAVIFREEKLLAGVAAVLGVAAMAVLLWWVLIVGVIAIIIVNALVS